jgi:uncharacterized protein (TIGR02300 family)
MVDPRGLPPLAPCGIRPQFPTNRSRPDGPYDIEGCDMPKEEWGVKRVCPTTGKRFYDLNRNPVVSPYTGEVVSIETGTKTRVLVADKDDADAKVKDDDDLLLDDDVDLDDDKSTESDDVLEDDDDDDATVPLDDLAVGDDGDDDD